MDDPWEALESAEGFDWDEGNLDKNLTKHAVEFWEAEEVLFNRPLAIRPDRPHSSSEPRYYALGRTDAGRQLFLVFALRRGRIRVISARDMTSRERAAYRHHV